MTPDADHNDLIIPKDLSKVIYACDLQKKLNTLGDFFTLCPHM